MSGTSRASQRRRMPTASSAGRDGSSRRSTPIARGRRAHWSSRLIQYAQASVGSIGLLRDTAMVTSANLMQGFPPQPMPFIGRSADLAEIGSLLATPTCRLLTLLGPGGIGKTRLAIEAATASLGLFTDGAGFVALQPLRSTDLLVSAIADALRLPHAGQTDPHPQLGHYLRDK